MGNFELCDLQFYKNYLIDSFEYCGNFKLMGEDSLVIDRMSIVTGTKIGQKACQHLFYSRFIFHTHPYTSKFYPSLQDMQKILKQSKIEYSVIFTGLGIWVLKLSGSFSEELINSEKIKFTIKKANDILYSKTDGGYKFNKQAVNEYIEILQKKFKKLQIKFYSWEEIDTENITI